MTTPRIIELVQGSEEWHAWRATRYTASQAASVMGLSPWFPRTPRQLYQLRTGQREVRVTDAMRDGNKFEARARELAQVVHELELVPVCFELDVEHAGVTLPLGASLDGWNPLQKIAAEFKAPDKGQDSELFKTIDPGHYLWNAAHTALCSGAEFVLFGVYCKHSDQLVSRMFSREELQPYIEKLLPKWAEFELAVQDLTPPAAQAGDAVERTDPEWTKAAQEYRDLLASIEELEGFAEAAKAKLVELAQTEGGCTVKGGGLSVFEVERAGNINWKAKPIVEALKAAKVDPEKHRAKPSRYWSVKREDAKAEATAGEG